MKQGSPLLLIFLTNLSAISSVANADLLNNNDVWASYETVKRTLPKDTAGALERAVDCRHFAGEINGDGSARDKEVNKTMNRLHCESVSKKVAAIKLKYKTNSAVLDAFKTYYPAE